MGTRDEGADVVGCLACDLSAGRRPLPGGLVHRTEHFRVEHCIGPLGVGTLVVKPIRHVTAVARLTDAEAAGLGPLLRDASRVAAGLVDADQVYNCLWSHAGGVPVHVHFVVQPVTAMQIAGGLHGPALQMAMFEVREPPDPAEVDRVAARARQSFAALPPTGGAPG